MKITPKITIAKFEKMGYNVDKTKRYLQAVIGAKMSKGDSVISFSYGRISSDNKVSYFISPTIKQTKKF